MQLIIRLIFLLVDIVGNIYMLSTHQPLINVTALPLDYVQFIVLFNAAMIMIIYIVDFIIVRTKKALIDLEIGEGLSDLYKHEH
jgi:TRAP-type C4-dicarboxylate transport system permease small subunit